MTKWQPIDTAPKDGTDVLVFEDPMMVGAYWDTDPRDEGGQIWRILGVCEYLHPTHWMPLPPAPLKKGDE